MAFVSPREIQRRRQLSAALGQQASSPAAIQRGGRSIPSGLANVLRQFGAGRGEFLANEQEQSNLQNRNSALAQALQGGQIDLGALGQSGDPQLQQLALQSRLQQQAAAPGIARQDELLKLRQQEVGAKLGAQERQQAALQELGGLVGQEGTTAAEIAPLLAQTGDVKGALALTPGLVPSENKKTFGEESKLRKTFLGQSKQFVLVNQAWERIKQSSDGTAAGDLSLIFNFMKMLDPGSTVREGEFATAQNSAGVGDRIRAEYNRLRAGERMAKGQRANFVAQAKKLFTAANNTHKQVEKQFRGIAERNGLNPINVVIDFRAPDAPTVEVPAPPEGALNPEEEAELKALEVELGR